MAASTALPVATCLVTADSSVPLMYGRRAMVSEPVTALNGQTEGHTGSQLTSALCGD